MPTTDTPYWHGSVSCSEKQAATAQIPERQFPVYPDSQNQISSTAKGAHPLEEEYKATSDKEALTPMQDELTNTTQPQLTCINADLEKPDRQAESQPRASSTVQNQPFDGPEPHAETEAIIQQVEFYFSNENLPSDAHLLSRTGEFGDGWVSLNEILGFKKMRRFKPPSRVKASLHQSEKLEIWKNKMIRRKDPLTVPLLVRPKVDQSRERAKILIEKPWLSKNMLKPTGFEEFATDGPVRLQEYNDDQELYHQDEAFTSRIEYAITRYCGRRKLHTSTANMLAQFLTFGGFNAGQRQFVGGLTKKELQEFDKEQILQMTARFTVSETVVDGFNPDPDDSSWVVDFETMAKAFLSSRFMASFDWKSRETVNECTSLLRNFYTYLLQQDVCPEFEKQIRAAIDVCDLAEMEFAKLAKVDNDFPGNFNVACSTLYGEADANIRCANSKPEWVTEGDSMSLSDENARAIFFAGISAHLAKDQLASIKATVGHIHERITPSSEVRVGLQVEYVEYMSNQAGEVYYHDRVRSTLIKPTGKLHCVYWEVPQAPPKDLPKDAVVKMTAERNRKYEFLIEEDILCHCYPGLKFTAVVKELAIGLKWIDSFEYVYPSFFTWILNEGIWEWREPGPPKTWQTRGNERQQGKAGQDPVE